MQEIQYLGESLWPKNIGHILIILGFVSAIFSSFSYAMAVNAKEKISTWGKMGRIGFITHGLSVLGIIGILAFIMINRYYEYAYVSQHVNDDLALRYIACAFWEGQEGSFLLWMFWHVILGFIIIFKSNKWEFPVISVLAAVQAIIITMILGIQFEIGDEIVKLGSNPLLLFRDTMDIPLFKNADYVSLLSGSGLNPLLQNYWMIIHPPTLFLGFASVTIPFCFAIAGFWTSKPREWVKPALKWALFCAGILGIGILMGGAWAYEALTFNGYWAWDPVENMSLVPWLIMVAGVHALLIANSTGKGIKTSYIFLCLSFVLILYSTFLTRSGVLGDTSVHAFTEMGLENQMLFLIVAFLGLSIFMFFRKRKLIPKEVKEDAFNSREFWMFIGTIVLLFSSILITASTSLPVYNKIAELFDPGFVGLVIEDEITHYNKHQIWIAFFLIVISSVAQMLRYQGRFTKSYAKKFFTHMGLIAAITAVLTFVLNLWLDIQVVPYFILMVAGVFGIVANIDYLFSFNKFQWKQSASIFAHVGFSIMIIGIIASGVNKRHISTNAFAFEDIMEDQNLNKKVTLLKGKPMFMNGYWVEYLGDTIQYNEKTYDIIFTKVDSSNKVLEEFHIYPQAIYSNDLSDIVAFNPSTKRYFDRDIFSHVAGLPAQLMKSELAQEMEDTLNYTTYDISRAEPIEFDSYSVELGDLVYNPVHRDYEAKENDLAVGLNLRVTDKIKNKSFDISPAVALRGAIVYKFYDEINDLNMRIRINEDFYESFFTLEGNVHYNAITLKEGQEIVSEGIRIRHKEFVREPVNQAYQKEDGDIAVSSILEFTMPDGTKIDLEPIYLIRGNRQTNIKDYDPKTGFHAKFTSIDPKTGNLEFLWSQDDRENSSIPLEIADNVPRSDIIVIESVEIPGINLFWLGSLMALFGFLIALALRMRSKNA